jgi:hypothetical protein
MGLGSDRSEWDDVEWFDLDTVSATPPLDHVWAESGGVRVLLCDLDNLRADPTRLRARMKVAVALARTADVRAFAGQEDAVRRNESALAAYADYVIAVGAERDAADHALLAVAAQVHATKVQFVVMSNDGIFASLAARGPLTVVSPGAAALSDRLEAAAVKVVDVDRLDRAA